MYFMFEKNSDNYRGSGCEYGIFVYTVYAEMVINSLFVYVHTCHVFVERSLPAHQTLSLPLPDEEEVAITSAKWQHLNRPI